MNAALLVPAGLFVMAMSQNATTPRSEHPPEVTALIERLPECSRLREQLQRGRFGDGMEKPYMRPMLDHGVQRIYFKIEGAWRQERAESIRIVRRLYYRQLDGPDAQITDAANLREIKNSGLEAMLDEAVLARGKSAHLFTGVDQWAGFGQVGRWRWQLSGGRIVGSIELFASSWLVPPIPDLVFPGKYREDVSNTAMAGDLTGLSKLLATHRYSQLELNRALNGAVMALWDNTRAIELLISAGADVNARFGEGTTPLMNAYECSCNIPVLLKHGAHVDDRNQWGQTALDLARQRHDMVAIRLLKMSEAKP